MRTRSLIHGENFIIKVTTGFFTHRDIDRHSLVIHCFFLFLHMPLIFWQLKCAIET